MLGKAKGSGINYRGVEINLVPDVKFELIRAEIMRSRVSTVAILIAISSMIVVALLSVITFGLQNYLISSADGKIKEQFSNYKNYNGVNQIITIQNQLSKLGPLHDNKPISSRLFNMIVSIMDGSGNSVRISRLDFDNTTREIKIEGVSSEGFIGLEKLQKSISATSLSEAHSGDDVEEHESVLMPLTDKVITNESATYGQDALGAQILVFNISFIADEMMFDSTKDITIIGPGRQDVTDSSTAIPSDIFAPKIKDSSDDIKDKE